MRRAQAPDAISEATRLGLARWLFSPLAGVTFGDWVRILGRYGASIPPKYWPRTAFTLMMSGLNSPLAWWEDRRYRTTIEAVRVARPVFVLGHYRSGTTHLWNLLAIDGQFAYPTVLQGVFPHTFLTMEKALYAGAQRLAPRKRPQDNVQFGPESPIEEERAICASSFLSIQMARHFPKHRESFKRYLTMREVSPDDRATWKTSLDLFARKLLVRYGQSKTLLFKAPEHTARIDLILELYPDARFIHIHRNPYDVYKSTRQMETRTTPLYAYQAPTEEGLDRFILWRYQEMYKAYLEDVSKIPPGQIAETSFAELEENPIGTLRGVYQTIGLSGFETVRPQLEQYVASISDYRKNSYAILPAETRRRIADTWRPGFAQWGYPE